MAYPEIDSETVYEELKKFYKKAEITSTDLEDGTLFTIDSYQIRKQGDSRCRVGLFFHKGRGEVLVDSSSEKAASFRTGNEKRAEHAGIKWIVVPEKYFWEFGRPAYWFVERNLTSYFGLENGFNHR